MTSAVEQPGREEVPAGVWRESGLEPSGEGDRVFLGPSAAASLRARQLQIAGGLAVGLVGALLLLATPWAVLGLAAGLLWAALGPRLVRPAPVLRLDRGELAPLQPELAGPGLDRSDIRAIHGAYETQGWDARSVIFAALADGTDRPILVIPGAGEKRPEAACRLLAALLDCPASYTGAFGKRIDCGGITAGRLPGGQADQSS
jgi:hypothetical protein